MVRRWSVSSACIAASRRALHRRVEHEEPDEPAGMPRDRVRHRLFVAGHACNQRGAPNAAAIQLVDPPIGEIAGRAGLVPSKRGNDVCRGLGRAGLTLRAERREKLF